jgi:protocatechuate 3,4-dioxygenase beta subunit
MISRRLAPLGAIALIAAAALVGLDARQAQRDPPRTTPPSIQTPSRDATTVALTGTSAISGVVTSGDSTPRPVRRAMVSLASPGATGRTTITDDNGRFSFLQLPAGRFTLAVSKPGWVTGYYGTRRVSRGPGTTIAVTDGQRVTANLTILRGGVIAGRIVDQFGQPQANVRPVVMEVRTIGGERTLNANAVRSLSSAQASTDDRGEYRIYGLPPGTYVIAATPPPGPTLTAARLTTADEIRWARANATATTAAAIPPPPQGPSVGFAPVFYPGTTDAAGATPIVLEAGTERTGVDFAMVPVPLAKVEGLVTLSDGQPAQGVQLSLSNPEAAANPYDTTANRAVASPQGRFLFPTVRPGRYRIIARGPSRLAPGAQAPSAAPTGRPAVLAMDLYAIGEVTVSGRDIDNVTLVLQPGTTISGRIAYEGAILTPPADTVRTQIVVSPPITTSPAVSQLLNRTTETYRATAQPDRTFSVPGILPGRYTLSVSSGGPGNPEGAGWTVKSIVIGGRDVTDSAFDIRPNEQLSDVVVTFTDRSSEIAGTIFDGAGRPAPGYFVFVFPAEREAWMVTSRRFRPPSQPSTDGKYRVGGLPPGNYFVAALTEFEELDMVDPTFLEQVAAASIRVTVKEGERKLQDLKIR